MEPRGRSANIFFRKAATEDLPAEVVIQPLWDPWTDGSFTAEKLPSCIFPRGPLLGHPFSKKSPKFTRVPLALRELRLNFVMRIPLL